MYNFSGAVTQILQHIVRQNFFLYNMASVTFGERQDADRRTAYSCYNVMRTGTNLFCVHCIILNVTINKKDNVIH